MPASKKIFFVSLSACGLSLLIFLNSNCRVSYGLHDVAIPDSIKTVKVNFIENHARYVNPQLSPNLTDKLRQKIVGQTRLTQTNGDNADWEISGYINDYSVSTSGISQQQTSINRLNVSVHISIQKRKENDQQEFDVTHSFDFSASLTLQAAESQLSDAIIRDMTDEIFNHIFSNW
ncbi:MAG: LPS assembly lipoprotein LptE [Chitinophagales bacterium]